MLIPVIMAGGSGTRLWPMSRKYLPKQFLPLTSEKTMLQETLLRLPLGRGQTFSSDPSIEIAKPIIVVGDEHRFLAAEQLREIGIEADILLEPEGKNTAPAIALAANFALQRELGSGDRPSALSPVVERGQTFSSDPCLLVLAADHVIQNTEAFHEAITQAEQVAKAGELVTFGIVPTEPHTGYGYIKRGQTFSSNGDRPSVLSPSNSASKVASFVEKPDTETAQKYLDSGDYLWNSGMFLFQAQTFLDELENFSPDISEPCKEAIKKAQQDLDFIRVDTEAFATSAEDSIDYAVMEKSDKVSVIPLDAGWNDVGSWTSLWDISEKDAQGNVIKSCEAIIENSQDCMLVGDERLISTIGVKDLIIVDTKDALLIADKNAVQDIKSVVAKIKQSGSGQDEFHRVVYRPWGNYDSIDSGERYQVKRITVKPGEKLSVQMHHHRAEHWVVVSGTAKVQRDEETLTLSENESVYLPIGCIHALENPGKIPLELIEVQSGSYLGEDDIVRFEDRYGR